jgi:hypothetical protein
MAAFSILINPPEAACTCIAVKLSATTHKWGQENGIIYKDVCVCGNNATKITPDNMKH